MASNFAMFEKDLIEDVKKHAFDNFKKDLVEEINKKHLEILSKLEKN